MTQPTATTNPTSKTVRNVMILLCALIGLGLSVLAITALPLEDERGIGLAYLIVFVIAALSITLIFRAFVKRR